MALAQGTEPTVPEKQPAVQQEAAPEKNGANAEKQRDSPALESLSPGLHQIESAIRDLVAEQRTAQEKEPRDHEISDLKAQQDMAFWAKLMFFASVVGTIVTGLGVWLVKQTLKETKRAANYTGGMLDEAKKTTATMNKSERAYIFGGGPHRFVNAEGAVSSHQFMVIQNHGRTIGFITLVEWGLCPPESNFPVDVPVSELIDRKILPGVEIKVVSEAVDNIIQPSREHQMYRHVHFGDEAMGSVFFGRIRFKDIYGDSHHSTFKLRLHAIADGSYPLPGCYSQDWQ